MTDKLVVHTSRDFAESYAEMTSSLATTVVNGAFETLPPAARKTLDDGAETHLVRARDDEGVVDLAVKFAGRRAGVCFWDELPAEQQAGPYLTMGIDYASNAMTKGQALMTAEIVLTDHDMVLVFGGPVDQAEAMASALADRLNLDEPAGGRLRVAMSRAEMVPITEWIKETFPAIGFVTRPLPLRAAKCPWRLFRLAADEDMRDALDDDTLIKTIAIVVDGMFEQHTKWGFESDAVIGSVVGDRDPMLRIVVEPAAHTVFIEELPPGTELPEKLSPTPYGDQPHH
jgi:hypothetical protein